MVRGRLMIRTCILHGELGVILYTSVRVTSTQFTVQILLILHMIYNRKKFNSVILADVFVRYLVDVKWMKQWKKYVGYDQWDQSYAGQDAANPGPIDNASLFRSKKKLV